MAEKVNNVPSATIAASAAPPADTDEPLVAPDGSDLRKKSKEQLIQLAVDQEAIYERYKAAGDMHACADALTVCLHCRELAFGEMSLPCAPIYHKLGVSLLAISQSGLEEAAEQVLMNQMAAAAGEPQAPATATPTQVHDFDDAWRCLERARLIYEKPEHGTKGKAANVRMSLADACFELEDYAKSQEEYLKAIEVYTELSDWRGVADGLFWSALCSQMLGDLPTSAAHIAQASTAMEKHIGTLSDAAEIADCTSILQEIQAKEQQLAASVSVQPDAQKANAEPDIAKREAVPNAGQQPSPKKAKVEEQE